MKLIINVAIFIAVISLVVGIISRFTLAPVAVVPGVGLEAQAFLAFTNSCLLFAMTLILLQIAKTK